MNSEERRSNSVPSVFSVSNIDGTRSKRRPALPFLKPEAYSLEPNTMSHWKSSVIRIAVLGVVMLTAALGRAAETNLRPELAKVAGELVKVLDKKRFGTVALGPFSGPSGATSAAEIISILTTELKPKGVEVKASASVTLRGAMVFKPDPEDAAKTHALFVNFELVDENGEVIVDAASGAIRAGKASTKVTNEQDILTALQPSVSLPPDASQPERLQKISDSLKRRENPPFIDERGYVFAQKARDGIGRYGVALYVDGKPVIPKLEEGTAIAEIPIGKAYEIYLLNETNFDAAAEVRIDGLNTFEFSEMRVTDPNSPRKGRPLYSNWIFGRNSEAFVPGWHKRDEGPNNISSFEVSRYAESAAATLNQTSGLGTVQVTFAAAWEGKDPPPELNEPPVGKRSAGTKEGDPKTVKITPAPRTIGVPRASVTIRYNREEKAP